MGARHTKAQNIGWDDLGQGKVGIGQNRPNAPFQERLTSLRKRKYARAKGIPPWQVKCVLFLTCSEALSTSYARATGQPYRYLPGIWTAQCQVVRMFQTASSSRLGHAANATIAGKALTLWLEAAKLEIGAPACAAKHRALCLSERNLTLTLTSPLHLPSPTLISTSSHVSIFASCAEGRPTQSGW